MKEILLLLALLLVNLTYAQVDHFTIEDYVCRSGCSQVLENPNQIEYDRIKGDSPFLFKDFARSKVIFNDIQFDDVLIRYNIYSETFQFKSNGKVMDLIITDKFKEIEVGNRHFFYLKDKRCYAERLYNGKLTLYSKPVVIFNEPEKPRAYQKAKPATFAIRNPVLYLFTSENDVYEIDQLKDFYKIFPKDSKAIKGFVRKHHVKLKSAADMIKLVTYISEFS